MRRFTLSRVAPGAFAFLTCGFAFGQAPTPPAAPAPTTPPAAAPAPATPPTAAPPAAAPAAPAPGTAPGTAPAPAPAPAEAPKTDAAPAPAPAEAKPTEPPAATAAPAAAPAAAEVSAAPKPQPSSEPKDELARPGYIPGYRRYPWLGLGPHVPHSASALGNTTAPYGAPGPADVWTFNYSGFFAAGVRAVFREDEDGAVIRNAVTSGEGFNAGGTQGSWVQMTFEYGNRIATARVVIDTWNPAQGSSFSWNSSQNFVDQAYFAFRIPPIDKLRLGVTIGAFSQTYGALGQYGGGFYSNSVGQISGIGETVSAEYQLTDEFVLTLDHGFMGRDKTPGGCVGPCTPGDYSSRTQEASNNLGDSYDPASFIQHAHVGIIKNGDLQLQGMLHWLQNWSQDDRGYLRPSTQDPTTPPSQINTDPHRETPLVDESTTRGDGSYDAYGATLGFRGEQWFRGGVGIVHATAENAYALHGLNVSYVGDGEQFSRDWIGPRSLNRETGDWEGSMWSASTEAEFSWGTFWRRPEPFWGEGFNVTTGVGFQYGSIDSNDPTRANWDMYRVGVDAFVSMLPWLAAGLRVDQVSPNTNRSAQTYHALTARLVFRTFWNSHEQVTLQYNKWIYGSEAPVNFRAPANERLDTDAISFGFGFWW